jgi:tRNA(Ile)-lysidine synthase
MLYVSYSNTPLIACWLPVIKNTWQWGPVSNALLQLSERWVDKLIQCKRLYVGFSGGLDSMVLLHFLSQHPSLKQKLQVIHVNHGWGPFDDAWQQDCKLFSEQLELPFLTKQVKCKQPSNQEAVARDARYAVFDEVVHAEDALILGHHQQDQAETLLLNLFRGAGIDGLCGIWEETSYRGYPIYRPFLTVARKQLAAYAEFHQLRWIEDESNQCLAHERNFIRHQVLPLLETRWPQVVDKLASVTSHAQQAEQNLYDLACGDDAFISPILNYGALDITAARISNVLWYWLKQHKVAPLNQNMVQRIMNELILNAASSGLKIEFAKHEVCSYQKKLHLRKKDPVFASHRRSKDGCWWNFPLPFHLPHDQGQLIVNAGQAGLTVPHGAQIEIRFRQGGERFRWRGQTKSLKKLWQAWCVPAWERAVTPLIYIDGTLAAVVGWAVSDQYYSKSETDGYTIQWRRS